MRNLIIAVILFFIGLGIGFGITYSFGNQILAYTSGPYFLPQNLTYDSRSGREDFSGQGWKVSVNKDWGLQEAVERGGLYASLEENIALFALKSPESKL